MKVILRNQIDLLNKNIVDTKVQNVMNKKKDVVLINQLENNLNYSSKFMGN